MNTYILKLLFIGIISLIFISTANAQDQKSGTEKILNTVGKTTVIIVGETVKANYKVGKFAVKIVFKPVAKSILKPLVLKVVPKTVGFLLEKSIPVGKKLFVTYLKTRLSL